MTNRLLPSLALAVLVATTLDARAACLTTTIAPDTALPAGSVGAAYSQALSASGAGTLPYDFAITSGIPAGLSMSAVDSTNATLAGTPTQAGHFLTTVTATDANGCSGGRTYALEIAPGNQTITFTSTAPNGAQLGDPPYTVAASASSGLAVTLSIDAASAAVCTLAGSTVSLIGVGTCTIDANQAGDANWNAAPQAQQSFAVGKTAQTISFTSTAPAAAVVGGAPYTVAATATSGLAVAFTIDPSASAVCSIAGANVSFHGAGTCVIDANQAGDATYDVAPQVQQSFVVGKGSQTISFTSTAPVAAVVGGTPYTVVATASSGLAVAFTVDPSASAVCSIAGASVSFHGVGTCVIDADQAGDANYNPAPRVQQSFAIGAGSQTIAFTSTAPAGAAVAGATYTVAATATSGLPVTFSIDAAAASVCSIAGDVVTFQSAGTCVIDANQAGDANWNPAAQIQQSFAVGPGAQTIAFTSTAPAAAVVAGATYTVSANATSGLPVTFSIDASASAVCSIAGADVSFQSAGTCVIDANQAGDANWNPAPQAQQSFLVGKGSQTISFSSTPPADAHIGGASYTVTATATSGLPVTFSIDASASSVCTISGSSVSFVGSGTCVIDANQAGDANWNAAPQAQQSFAVSACIALTVGQVVLDQMPGGADFCVLNTDGAGAEFTYLPINIDPTNDVTLSLTGTNVVAVTGPPTPIAPTPPSPLAPLATPSESFDVDYHPAEAASAFPPGHVIEASSLVHRNGLNAGPLTVGQLIDLNASVGGCGATPDIRKGRVEAITTPQSAGQQVLYAVQEVVETAPGSGVWQPPVVGGFVTADFQAIIDSFVQSPPGATAPGSGMLSGQLKTGMMNTYTGMFGALSDVDGNGGVIVFFTKKLNELSPPASSAIATGLFQQRDLFAAASCPGSNQAEMLYMMVPDPTGAVNSNVRTVSFTYGNAGPTLVHNFEHLINASRRLYFNGAAPLEEQWLDEGLAWSGQELAFFNASVGLTPRSNIALTNLTTGPNASVRVADFNTYQNPMYGSMRTYFLQLNGTNGNMRLGPFRQQPLSTGFHDVTAPNFSNVYAFLRYAIDRKNTGDAALFNALVNTTQTGIANLQTVLGVDPNEWMRDFLVAFYTDDAGIAVDPRYTLPSWNFRSVYGGLGGFPLTVNPLGDGVPLNFVLSRGGGTRYARFGVAAGQSANIGLTQGGASPTAPITTALMRTK